MLMTMAKLLRLSLATFFLILGIGLLAFAYKFNPSDASARNQQERRQLIDRIPKQVPLRVKIKKDKEDKFKDVTNADWASDFELEVTNVGDKPIYNFYLMCVTELKWDNGDRVLFPLYYGRTELGDHRVKATPDDIPVSPGQSIVLKFNPGTVAGWERVRVREGKPHPRKIQVMFELLSFGDGTGIIGEDGTAVPRKPRSANIQGSTSDHFFSALKSYVRYSFSAPS
jgi:hypothetical protein